MRLSQTNRIPKCLVLETFHLEGIDGRTDDQATIVVPITERLVGRIDMASRLIQTWGHLGLTEVRLVLEDDQLYAYSWSMENTEWLHTLSDNCNKVVATDIDPRCLKLDDELQVPAAIAGPAAIVTGTPGGNHWLSFKVEIYTNDDNSDDFSRNAESYTVPAHLLSEQLL